MLLDMRIDRAGASERMYAQCHRQQLAYDFVLKVFEPRHQLRYAALIRARLELKEGLFK